MSENKEQITKEYMVHLLENASQSITLLLDNDEGTISRDNAEIIAKKELAEIDRTLNRWHG